MKKVRLSSIAMVKAGGTPSRSNLSYWNGDIPWVKISDIQGKHVQTYEETITEEGLKNSSAKLFSKGTILYTIFATLGRVGILDFDATTNQAIAGINILDETIDCDYLYYFLRSQEKKVKAIGKGVAQQNINLKILRDWLVPIRSKEEQTNIAGSLEKIEGAISAKNELLNSFDSLVKSRFNEMFGDPMDEKKWNSKFTKVVIFNPKKSEVKKDMEIEASFVPMEAIGTDGSFSIKKSGKIKDFYKGYTYFKDGDVIFAKITPCFENGKIAIANHCTNKIGFGTTEFHVARPIFGKTNAEWVMNLLRNDSLHTYASSKMTGSAGQKRIQTPFFEKLGVYLPPLELQNRFADFVHLVDKSRFVVQKEIKDLQELLDSKMDEYFGGEE